MDAVVGWVGLGVAVIAAVATVWQAREARQARIDAASAQVASAAAADAARVSAEAAVRSADAAEQDLALRRADAERYEVPWRVTKRGNESWSLVLGGAEDVTDLTVTFEPDDAHADFPDGPLPATMHPGEGRLLYWGRSIDAPASVSMVVRWRRPSGGTHVWRYMLS